MQNDWDSRTNTLTFGTFAATKPVQTLADMNSYESQFNSFAYARSGRSQSTDPSISRQSALDYTASEPDYTAGGYYGFDATTNAGALEESEFVDYRRDLLAQGNAHPVSRLKRYTTAAVDGRGWKVRRNVQPTTFVQKSIPPHKSLKHHCEFRNPPV